MVEEYVAGIDTQITTDSETINSISVFVLNNTKIFIAIHYSSSMYGVVCTINGDNIIVGTKTLLVNKNGGIVKLSENQLFISYISSDYRLYGKIVDIAENIITVKGGSLPIGSLIHSNSPTPIIVQLSSNKVFIVHNANNQITGSIYGVVCTISEDTITNGTDTLLTNGYGFNAIKVANNKVFIYWCYSNRIARGIVCSVSNTTITTGSTTQILSSEALSSNVSINLLEDNKIFIGHSDSSSYYPIYGRICTISGTSISLGTDTKLHSSGVGISAGYRMVVKAMSSNRIFITYTTGTNNTKELYCMICDISTSITVVTKDRKLSNKTFMSDSSDYFSLNLTSISYDKICVLFKYRSVAGSNPVNLDMIICEVDADGLVKIKERIVISDEASSIQNTIGICTPKGNIFVGYVYLSYSAYIKMMKTVNSVLPIISPDDDIYGVAKTNATEGDTIDIYRPYEEVAV